MPNQISVTFEGNYVQVLSDGEKSLEHATALWSKVSEACDQPSCFDVLGIANSSQPMEAVDGYDHARLFRELGIGAQYRIAWVELNPEAVDMANFIETVLVNRGLPGQVFATVEQAREWLVGDAKKQS